MKRIILIGVLIVALAAAGVTAVLVLGDDDGKKAETPYEILMDAIQKTAHSRMGDSAAVWEAALQGGSIEETLTIGDFFHGDSSRNKLAEIYGKTSFGEGAFAQTIGATTLDNEKIEAALYLKGIAQIIATCSAVDDAYGVNTEDIMGIVEGFLPSDVDMPLPSLPFLPGQASSIEVDESVRATFEKIFGSIDEHIGLVYTEAESSLTFRVSITNETVATILEEIIAALEEDEDFIEKLLAMVEDNVDIPVDAPVTMPDANTIMAMLPMFEQYVTLIKNTEVSFDFVIIASTDRIINNVSISLKAPGFAGKLPNVTEQPAVSEQPTVTARPTVSAILAEGVTLNLDLTKDGGFVLSTEIAGQTYSVSHTITTAGKIRTEKLTLSLGNLLNMTPLTLDYNTEKGDYTLKFEIPSITAKVEGTYTATKDSATLTIDSVTFREIVIGEEYAKIEIKANAKDTLTVPSKFNDLAKYEPNDLADLGEDVMNAIENDDVFYTLINFFGSLFGNAEDSPAPQQ